MPLPAHLVAMFPKDARKKGRAYAAGGDVRIDVMTEDQVEAGVRGERNRTAVR